MNFPQSEAGNLAGFSGKTVRISSTAPPVVDITNDGISVTVNLRARATLFSESPKLEIRTEFESRTEWQVTATLAEKDGRYSLVPHVTASVDVWTGKLYVGAHRDGMSRSSQQRLEDGNMILEAIEKLLNAMLEDNIAALMEDDVRSGIPLNIPLEYLTLGSADICLLYTS